MNTKIIYLDNAATTKPYESVLERFLECQKHYFNPSALYQQANDGAITIKNAKKSININNKATPENSGVEQETQKL